MDLNGIINSISMIMDGRNTFSFEIGIDGVSYRFQKEFPFADLHDMSPLQGKLVKLKGNLDGNSKQILDVSDLWVKII